MVCFPDDFSETKIERFWKGFSVSQNLPSPIGSITVSDHLDELTRLRADLPDVCSGWQAAIIERGRHESGGHSKGR